MAVKKGKKSTTALSNILGLSCVVPRQRVGCSAALCGLPGGAAGPGQGFGCSLCLQCTAESTVVRAHWYQLVTSVWLLKSRGVSVLSSPSFTTVSAILFNNITYSWQQLNLWKEPECKISGGSILFFPFSRSEI